MIMMLGWFASPIPRMFFFINLPETIAIAQDVSGT